MPQEWMALGHRWAGLGELPPEPIVGYLARSTSALYGLRGAILLYVSFDVERYWSLICFLAAAAIAHGAALVWIDLGEGLPRWWAAVEGPSLAATGIIVLVLQRLMRGSPPERRTAFQSDAPVVTTSDAGDVP